MKPQAFAITLVAVLSLCGASARAEVIDGMKGKWKAVGSATVFEVFPQLQEHIDVLPYLKEGDSMTAAKPRTWVVPAS